MNILLTHLPHREQNTLRDIAKHLLHSINPKYLFCFGSRSRTTDTCSCFQQNNPVLHHEYQCDLLIVVNEREARPEKDLLLLAKKATCFCQLANIMVQRRDMVFFKLLEGDFFYSWVFRHAIPLIGEEQLPLLVSEAGKHSNKNMLYSTTLNSIHQLLTMGSQSLKAIAPVRKAGDTAKALQLIGQSLTASLCALLLTGMGYQHPTDSLDVLLNLTCNFTPEPAAVFPRHTPEEIRLFRLVENAGENTEPAGNADPGDVSMLVKRAWKMNELAAELLHKNNGVLGVPHHGRMRQPKAAN